MVVTAVAAMAVGAVAAIMVEVVIMVEAVILEVMASGTHMAVAGIMADLALRRALDTAVRTSVRSAMHPSARRISAMRSICIPAPSATAV